MPTVPVQKNSPFGRFYDVDGASYPSVTHILQVISKPALINWAANQERTLVSEAAAELYLDLAKIPTAMPRSAYLTTLQARIGKMKAHQKELAKAGEIGTQVHHLIEWNLRRSLGQVVGPEPRVVDDAEWAFMAWQDWANSVQLRPRHIEQVVFSRDHEYAGTMDLLADVSGVLTLIDFKTGKAIYGEALLQNVAYQHALDEMGHLHPVQGLIVRLPKIQTDPAFEVAVVPPVDHLFPTFLACKQVWQWWYAQDEPWRTQHKAKLPLEVTR
jgi:PD-(D/E)XK nuclease superfamily protein